MGVPARLVGGSEPDMRAPLRRSASPSGYWGLGALFGAARLSSSRRQPLRTLLFGLGARQRLNDASRPAAPAAACPDAALGEPSGHRSCPPGWRIEKIPSPKIFIPKGRPAIRGRSRRGLYFTPCDARETDHAISLVRDGDWLYSAGMVEREPAERETGKGKGPGMDDPGRPPLSAWAEGVRRGDRATLARAITLVESRRPERRRMAAALLQELLPFAGAAYRIGVTGAPGVGKSTTIDQFGVNLIEAGHRVAVLAVDPSSRRTGGSILGDKTRMARLSRDERAFIRPSPSGGFLGGVARATRETMVLCEAAGYDVVIVETVGVGQSETAVAGMVDFFLVLLLPGGGDELQGMKKGVAELADMIVINKADGDAEARARITAGDYQAAMNILTPRDARWRPPVITISALANRGLDGMWEKIAEHRRLLTASGAFEAKRREQGVRWMNDLIEEGLQARIRSDAAIAARITELEGEVRAGRAMPARAAEEILERMARAMKTGSER